MPNVVANSVIVDGSTQQIQHLYNHLLQWSAEQVHDRLGLSIVSRLADIIPAQVVQLSPTQLKLVFTSAWEPPRDALQRICTLYEVQLNSFSVDTDQYPEESGVHLHIQRTPTTGAIDTQEHAQNAKQLASQHFPEFYHQQLQTEPLDRAFAVIQRQMEDYVVGEYNEVDEEASA